MAADAKQGPALFGPTAFQSFAFGTRRLDASGRVSLAYALDGGVRFTEEIQLPLERTLGDADIARVDGLLALLHWVAGVSYYKAALPPAVAFAGAPPGPAAAALLDALYSEGLGEFAYVNDLAALPSPSFGAGGAGAGAPAAPGTPGAAAGSGTAPTVEAPAEPRRLLVPVGGGKDSVVALEIVRRGRRWRSRCSRSATRRRSRGPRGRRRCRGCSRRGGWTPSCCASTTRARSTGTSR